jgi:hypothetical protein
MRLPARGLHQLLEGGAVRPLQQIEDLGGFGALAGGLDRLRRLRALWLFGALLGQVGLLPRRLGLAGRNTGASVARCWPFWRLSARPPCQPGRPEGWWFRDRTSSW